MRGTQSSTNSAQALNSDSFRAKHNRRSAKALFEQIKAEGYDGGCSQLTAFVRSWRGEQRS